MSTTCPELELLFSELAEGRGPALDHAQNCERCAAIIEEHRQLEKDLFRLADPLPPPEFIQQVMAKVAAAPAPARTELRAGASILLGSLALCAASLFIGGFHFGELGVAVASAVIGFKDLALGLEGAIGVFWRTSALPALSGLTGVLFFALYGLKRLGGGPAHATVKVSP